MSRNLLLGAATCALALGALATMPSPSHADVPAGELVIEGPIAPPNPERPGTIRVMGIDITAPGSGTFDTPTRQRIPLSRMSEKLPGRLKGFIGGTAIVTGGSTKGEAYATNVFSDVNENVIVGEVTQESPLKVNGLLTEQLPLASDDLSFPIPSNPPQNIYGFNIDPTTIDVGTLISIEGYIGDTDGKLYWHTLEADAGRPMATKAEVSILRASCRRNGGTGRDELDVRGAVHPSSITPRLTAPVPPVQIYLQGAMTPILSATPTIVTGVGPRVDGFYGEYVARSNRLTLGRCPQNITVRWAGDSDAQITDVQTQ